VPVAEPTPEHAAEESSEAADVDVVAGASCGWTFSRVSGFRMILRSQMPVSGVQPVLQGVQERAQG
jgi:hypothetical protein